MLQIFMEDAAKHYEDSEAGPFFYEIIERKGGEKKRRATRQTEVTHGGACADDGGRERKREGSVRGGSRAKPFGLSFLLL